MVPILSSCKSGKTNLSLSDLERVSKYTSTPLPLSPDSQLRWWDPLQKLEVGGNMTAEFSKSVPMILVSGAHSDPPQQEHGKDSQQ